MFMNTTLALAGRGPNSLWVSGACGKYRSVELDEILAGLEVLRLWDGDVANLEWCGVRGDDGGLYGLGDGVLGDGVLR